MQPVGWTEHSDVQQFHDNPVGVRWRSPQPTRAWLSSELEFYRIVEIVALILE